MTKSTPRHELWREEYLGAGEGRSLGEFIHDAPRIARERGWGRVPSARTIRAWYTDHAWDDCAKRHDAEVWRIARSRHRHERAELAEAIKEQALECSGMFHALVDSWLIVEIPVPNEDGNPRFTVNKDGSLTPVMYRRPRRPSEVSRQDFDLISALHRAAANTDHELQAGAEDRYEESLAREDGAPAVTELGPESLHEMKALVKKLTRRLDAQAKRQGAAGGASTAGQ